MTGFQRQRHGHINPIFAHEEAQMLAAVDKAHSSSSNSQILGKNGEAALCSLLNRYLPISFRTVAGHFVTPSGKLSPELDVMVMDARYPLLAENQDGSVLAMLHSVIATIEVKRTLVKKEVLKIRKNASLVGELQAEVFPSLGEWGGVIQLAFAYRSGITVDTVANHYFDNYSPDDPASFIHILRVHDKDQMTDEGPLGAHVWMEASEHPATSTTLAPLSDFYYQLIQDGFYTLNARNFDFGDLGAHAMSYMNWGTFPCLNRGAT
ncbi:MAG: hypothetical protein LUQ11_11185 [Methylococcaceae bacterium]|nr:hypothetical protein [Methylococcaceae bacterium]